MQAGSLEVETMRADLRTRARFLESVRYLIDRPTGALRTELEDATGVTSHNVKHYVNQLLADGALFVAGKSFVSRYFLSAKAAESGGKIAEAERALKKKVRCQAADKARWSSKSRPIVFARASVLREKKPPTPYFAQHEAVNLTSFPITYVPGIERMYQPAPIEHPVFSAMRPGQYL